MARLRSDPLLSLGRRVGRGFGRCFQQELRQLGEGVVREDDVIAWVEIFELLQDFVSGLHRIGGAKVVAEIDFHLQLVELTVFGDDNAADVRTLNAFEVHFDGIGKKRAGKGREGPDLAGRFL